MPEDYSMDEKIWNDGIDYFIDSNDFNPNSKTKLPKGTELTVYNESTKTTVATYFASPLGNWILR